MRNAPANWNTYHNNINHTTETRVDIDGVSYYGFDGDSGIWSLETKPALFEDFGIGNAYSAQAGLILINPENIPKMAKIEIYQRLRSGNNATSWMRKGVFFTSTRQLNASGTHLTIHAYDAMRKGDQIFAESEMVGVSYGVFKTSANYNGGTSQSISSLSLYWKTDDASSTPGVGSYIVFANGVMREVTAKSGSTYTLRAPVFPSAYPMSDIMALFISAVKMGVNVDSRTVTLFNHAYDIQFPGIGDGALTARDVLKNLSAMYGGNAIITDEGELRIVPLKPSNTAIDIGTDAMDINPYVPLDGIGEIRLIAGDNVEYHSGTGGTPITADCVWATQTIADNVKTALSGYVFQPIDIETLTNPDPLMELGDALKVDGKTTQITNVQNIFSLKYICSIFAPHDEEIEDEFPMSAAGSTSRAVARQVAKSTASLTVAVDAIDLRVETVEENAVSSVRVLYAQNESTTDPPTTGWSETAPQWEAGKYIWQKTETTYLDGRDPTYSTPTVLSGAQGRDGANAATVFLYKRAGTGIAKPTAELTYTFATGALSGDLAGWSQTYPATTQDGNIGVYVIQATAIGTGATDKIPSSEWSTPRLASRDSGNTAVVNLFIRSATTPSITWSNDLTYSFSTHSLTSHPTGWTESIPSGTNPLYVTAATAFGIDTDDIAYSEWSTPVLLAENGADGQPGAPGTSIIWKGSFATAPSNPQNGWAYYNTTTKKSYAYQDGSWYQMTADGTDGQNGSDGISIVWKGESSTPPYRPSLNWVYRDTDDGKVYIYNGTSWALMVLDGSDGTDGTNGSDGKSVFVTYHNNPASTPPSTPTGDGTSGGWHTNATAAAVWISQKVSESATTGTWGTPIRIKGTDGTNGRGISRVAPEYALSASAIAPPTTGWSETPVDWSSGNYVWTRSHIYYTDGTNATTNPVIDALANGLGERTASLTTRVDTIEGQVSGKVTTFFAATAPTATGTGDLWYCTASAGNYTQGTWYRWNGTSWEATTRGVKLGDDWQNQYAYKKYDLVTSTTNGRTYAALQDHTSTTSNAPPASNYWYEVTTIEQAAHSNFVQSIDGFEFSVDPIGTGNGTKFKLLYDGAELSTDEVDLHVKSVNIDGDISVDNILMHGVMNIWENGTRASGAWSSTKAYVVGDVVRYGNVMYSCKINHTGHEPGSTGWGTYWTLVNSIASTFGYYDTGIYGNQGVGIETQTSGGSGILYSSATSAIMSQSTDSGANSSFKLLNGRASMEGTSGLHYSAKGELSTFASGAYHHFYVNGGEVAVLGANSLRPVNNSTAAGVGLTLGDSSHRWDVVYARSGSISTSDRKEKTNINYDMSTYDGLFDSLKPVSYKLKSSTSDRLHLGFIAQDVEDSLTALGIDTQNFAGFIKSPVYSERNDDDSEDKTSDILRYEYGLRYEEFIPLLTSEIQKLKARISELEATK